ncbi:poly(A) polymerase small subunit VP39 [Mythimna separata entomopoxvirus 'L']|uniref:Cap-specific mRNA (nucleoside-2'-O-)-methyltransferase n=1 Tax=Mythimna separata entomopoxvirus 'L' TaxID=1293572 RepID=A0A916KQ32_9POXV|nr:poly(A) polymerase small subunit VP39 [Mythimna separata entomopoxvirus 'L']CCU56281.1 poly(A) polymerase small subunit VP39 [Mythimna separata entomopoxvirus 'L']
MSYNPIIYYISDIKNERNYKKSIKPYIFNFRKPGQIKLLINEIRFLSEDVEIYKNYKNKCITILYIGSGKGYHIPLLIDMYSNYNIIWHFYDPNGHCNKLNEIASKNKNVKIYDRIFNKQDVELYEDISNLLFISDIRTIDDDKIEPNTKNLVHDYDIQNYILKQLKPIALIKQRDPFPDDWNDSYEMYIPDGKEYVQCFQKHDSAEYRIFICGATTFIKVDLNVLNSRNIDKKLAWYNTKYRFDNNNDYKIAYRVLNKYIKTENKPILKYTEVNKNNIKNIIKSISKNITNN